MPRPKTGETLYHAQLGLPDKCPEIKELVDCNRWDISDILVCWI